MIKAIIFDLDNCLSAADEPGRELLAPVFHAIQRHHHGQFSAEALAEIRFDCWRHPLDWIARKHRFSAELQAAAWAAYESLEVRVPMRGYPDLGVLSELAVLRFLVTSGFRRMQESKIRALGIASHFTAIHIDALGDANRVGKEGIFRNILSQYRLPTAEVLVVGDNPDSELEAGNRLGIVTVQILRPEVPRGHNATHIIHGLAELKALIRDLGNG